MRKHFAHFPRQHKKNCLTKYRIQLTTFPPAVHLPHDEYPYLLSERRCFHATLSETLSFEVKTGEVFSRNSSPTPARPDGRSEVVRESTLRTLHATKNNCLTKDTTFPSAFHLPQDVYRYLLSQHRCFRATLSDTLSSSNFGLAVLKAGRSCHVEHLLHQGNHVSVPRVRRDLRNHRWFGKVQGGVHACREGSLVSGSPGNVTHTPFFLGHHV